MSALDAYARQLQAKRLAASLAARQAAINYVQPVLNMPTGVEQYNALLNLAKDPNALYGGTLPSGVLSKISDYDKFAQYCALNMEPNYIQAVQQYNAGQPLTQPWFKGLFANLNNYYQQGQFAPGNAVPAAGQQAVKQWQIDAEPGGLDRAMMALQQYATIALSAYMGGVLAGQIGAAIGKEAVKQMNAPENPAMQEQAQSTQAAPSTTQKPVAQIKNASSATLPAAPVKKKLFPASFLPEWFSQCFYERALNGCRTL